MFALKGKREYQEDSGLVLEFGDLLVFAIADGFNKPGERGSVVSQRVIASMLERIATDPARMRVEPERFLADAFAAIDAVTRHHIAGSTLSLVIIDRVARIATLAYVGDSPIVLTDHDDTLHIHPYGQMRARDRGLQTAFGDVQNAHHRANVPSIVRHTLSTESVIIVSSDGLYPLDPENDMMQLSHLARHYISMIRDGASPRDLAAYASESEHSADNITVAVYQAER